MSKISTRAAMLTLTTALSAALGGAHAQENTTGTNTTAAQSTTLPDTTLPDTTLPDTTTSDTSSPAETHPITLNLRTPVNATQTLVFQALPAGLSFTPGSVTLNGKASADPLIGPDGLYFEFSGAASGTLTFSVTGPESGDLLGAGLRVHYPQGQAETLQGTFDETAFALAKPADSARPERAGVIRAPADGTVLSSRRSVNVTVDVPLGKDTAGALSVNGKPVDDAQIGKKTLYSDGHTRLDFIAVPLDIGDNALTSYSDTVHVRTAGTAAKLLVTPSPANIADGSTPLDFTVEVQDKDGTTADLPNVSVTVTGSEPLGVDADPNQSGYQIALQSGKGKLTLRPLALPGTVTLTFDVNGHAQTVSAAIHGDRSTILVAHSGGTVSAGQASFQGAASIEAPILDGKLYVAANSQGVNQEPLPFARYPAYGDASVGSQPLHAQGKVAARLVTPNVHAEFGQDAAVDPVFGIHTGADGLNAETNGQTRAGFGLTQVMNDQQTVTLTPDGTRVLHLSSTTVPGSETVILVTSVSGVEVSRRTLSRNLEYVLGGDGLLEFPSPLLPVDTKGQDVRLLVSYRSGQATGSTVTAGVHLTHDLGVHQGDTEVNIGSVSAGAVLIGSVVSVGVHAKIALPQGGAETLIAASGGALYGTLNAAYSRDQVQAGLTARYEGSGYTGPGAGAPGVNVSAAATYKINANFGVKVSVNGNRQDLTNLQGVTVPGAGPGLTGIGSPATSRNLDLVAAAGVTYQNGPFTADLLLRRNFSAAGFGVQGSVTYTKGETQVSVSHAQDFGAGQSLSVVTATTALGPDLKLGFSVSRDWYSGSTLGGLTLSGTRGGVNYVAGYDLPSEGGSLGRARLAAITSIPLAPGLTSDLAASISTDTGLTGSLGATLRYQDTGTQASLGTDASLSPAGTKFDLKSSVNVSYGLEWTLGADGLSEFGSGVQGGNRYGLGVAWRGDSASALGYLRFRNGSFGGQALTGEVDLEQRPDFRSQDQRNRDTQDLTTRLAQEGQAYQDPARSKFDLRESLALSVPLGDGAANPTVQGLIGARYWFTDTFALGLGAGLAYQYGSAFGSRLGLEASIVPLSGLMLTAGYNILGFSSDLGNQPTRPGAYLKFDLLLDEVHK
jgi:hypothetical protein